MNKLFVFLIGSMLLLQGCTTNSVKSLSTQTEPTIYTPGEFNQESLYALLLAEFAGHRRLFPIALEQYLEQAEKTRDSAVAERATRIAQYLREPDKILQAARLWRKISPNNQEPYQLEANILLHQGQHQDALPLLNKALEFDPLSTLALIRTKINEIAPEAISSYLNIIELYKKTGVTRADLELTLALLYEKNANPQQALLAFDRSLKLEPSNPEALIHKAEMLKNEGDPSTALSLIETAFEQQPDNRQLQILYTQLLFAAEQHKSAVKQAQILLSNNPKDQQLSFYLALLMLDYKQLDGAANALNNLLALKPNDSSPHFYLGHISQTREQIADAIKHYLSVRHGSNILPALARATGLLNKPTDKTQIQNVLQERRATIPALSANLYTLEAEWLNLHNFSHEAEALLEEALNTEPDNTTLLYTRAMMVESTNFTQAEKDLRKILRLEPDNALVKNALGYTLTLHSERYDEAFTLISEALKSQPEDPAILDSMGWVLHKLNRTAEALPYLEKAHRLYSDPEVSNHLIQVYWFSGQKEKAHNLLQSSEKKHPDNPFLEEAKAIINDPVQELAPK